MARTIGKLSAAAIASKNINEGMHGDGGGLYLKVGPTGYKSWIFRFKVRGKGREMGLGAVHIIGLADARTLAVECRRLRLEGIDPIAIRHSPLGRIIRATIGPEGLPPISSERCSKKSPSRNLKILVGAERKNCQEYCRS